MRALGNGGQRRPFGQRDGQAGRSGGPVGPGERIKAGSIIRAAARALGGGGGPDVEKLD
jgi:hypothetical protein